MSPDLINGFFESGGTLVIWLSILKLRNDKEVKGISWAMVAFFTSWGYWNTYYYHHLFQWFSWVAGIALAASNTIYLFMLIHYSKHPGGKQ